MLSIQYMNISNWYCKVIRGCLYYQSHLSKILLVNDFRVQEFRLRSRKYWTLDSHLGHCKLDICCVYNCLQCKMKVDYVTRVVALLIYTLP